MDCSRCDVPGHNIKTCPYYKLKPNEEVILDVNKGEGEVKVQNTTNIPILFKIRSILYPDKSEMNLIRRINKLKRGAEE